VNEEVTMTIVSTALAIATAAHAEHVDKNGQAYIDHPKRVAVGAVQLAEPVGLDLDVVHAVALLHDVVEDSDVTLDDLAVAGLPPAVVEPVGLLTHAKDAPRGPYLKAIARDPVALVVKLADTLDNTDPVRIAALPADVAARLTAKYAGQLTALRDAYAQLERVGRLDGTSVSPSL
jgi:(p)ppGpp synthase/HD superfamily hydrolase